MPERQQLTEARPTLLAEATGTPGRYRVQLINPGWGSSGYYSAATLAEAAARKVFAAGMKMYADHPTATEEVDRPERSVRDVWGKLVTEATVGADGALLAEVDVRPDVRPVVDFLSDAIGLSIRGEGTFHVGEAEGRQGRIITSIEAASSVDFVTDAGRGGQILALVESAGHTLLGEATANDVRDALDNAVTDAYGGKQDVWTWVRDYDPDAKPPLVYFDVSGADSQQGTYQQAYTIGEDGAASLTGEREEVVRHTSYEVVAASNTATTEADTSGTTPPAGDPPATPNAAEAAAQADHSAPTEESAMTETPGADGTAPLGTARQVIQQELAEMRRMVAQSSARDRAREVIAEALTDAWLPPLTISRITGELLEADRLPLVNDALDEAALRDAATKARDRAEQELAEAMQAAGVGRPRGLGSPAGGNQQGGDVTDTEARLEESFKSLGMTESAATTAAKGR